jgi:CRP/FNR family transcriptional regulator
MKYYKKGIHIGRDDGITDDIYFLKKGSIKIVRLCDNGEEIIKDVINEGDIFGLLGLLYGENRNDYAVAMEDAVVCIIDAITLKKMMTENQKLNNYIFKLAGLRIQKLERKLESLIHKDAETRIADFIRDYILGFGKETDAFFVAKHLLSDSEIGKLTSTSRQTVNKTLNRLKRNGIIDFDRVQIRLNKKNLKN